MSQIWTSRVTHMNICTAECQFRRTRTSLYLCFMSCVWTSHGTHMNESCHAYMSQSRQSYAYLMYSHMHESFVTYNYRHGIVSVSKYADIISSLLSHICMSCVIHLNASYQTYAWDMLQRHHVPVICIFNMYNIYIYIYIRIMIGPA